MCLEELNYEKLIQCKSIWYEVVGKTNDDGFLKAQKMEYHETQPKALNIGLSQATS